MDELDTTSLHDLVARFQAGENSALHALIRRTEERLSLFTRRMLARFPAVRAKEQTDDILQNALIRLTRALRQETPRSVREFFGLASELDRWTALHEAVERLPADRREVFSYVFYHGWTQSQLAELLGVSDRQVRRLWIDACLRLKEAVGKLPAQ
ncbi:MAG: hypothetical protein HYS12_16525 [Planctomycetes bacterium]|nr:hypothetical protein [Planctomycetota bacterium]